MHTHCISYFPIWFTCPLPKSNVFVGRYLFCWLYPWPVSCNLQRKPFIIITLLFLKVILKILTFRTLIIGLMTVQCTSYDYVWISLRVLAVSKITLRHKVRFIVIWQYNFWKKRLDHKILVICIYVPLSNFSILKLILIHLHEFSFFTNKFSWFSRYCEECLVEQSFL